MNRISGVQARNYGNRFLKAMKRAQRELNTIQIQGGDDTVRSTATATTEAGFAQPRNGELLEIGDGTNGATKNDEGG